MTWAGLFAARAEDDRAAVVAGEVVLSGRELAGLGAGVSAWLDDADFGPAHPVPVVVDTTIEAFALLAACAGSNRPIMPLAPRASEADLAHALRASGAHSFVVAPKYGELGARLAAATRLTVRTLADLREGDQPLDFAARPGDVAAVLHTSGTTGRPKPIVCSHHRLGLRCQVNAHTLAFDDASIYATASPFHHTSGIGLICVALAAGGAVVPFPRFSVEAWHQLDERSVTHALLVPTMLDRLLSDGRLARRSLRHLHYGAAAIHPTTLALVLDALPDVQITQVYGQTEGAPITALTPADHRVIAAEGVGAARIGSAGRAAQGVELAIAEPDRDGVGEVRARAAHFFAPEPDGWLHTGDLGRIDAQGYLWLQGRTDDMIVRGGENVHPLGVEAVLAAADDVAEVAVVGWPDQRWGQVVVAFVVSASPAGVDLVALEQRARAALAHFAVPTEWRVVEQLPRTATGKVRRNILREHHT